MTSPALTNNISKLVAMLDIPTQIPPQYEADEGALTIAQLEQIKQHQPQDKKRSVRSSLFELKTIYRKR